MPDCIFCKIADGEIQSTIVYSDDDLVAFEDVNPQAPVHILVIPRRHISTLNDLSVGDSDTTAKMIIAAAKIAKDRGISDSGYRLVFNCNRGAGQSVFHIHMHLLGGRSMNWPPG